MKKEALEVLKNRRSIRKFQSRQISAEELDTVLEAGTYAPTAGGRQAAEKISGSIPKRHRSDRLERIARKPELSHPRSELRQCENLALRRRPVHVGSPVGQEPKTGIGRIVTHCRAVPANKDRCSVRLRTYRFKRYRHPFGQGGSSAPAPPAQRSGRNRPEHSLVCNNRFHTFSIWDKPCDLPV